MKGRCKDCEFWLTPQCPPKNEFEKPWLNFLVSAIIPWLGTCEKKYQIKTSFASCGEFIRRGTDGKDYINE